MDTVIPHREARKQQARKLGQMARHTFIVLAAFGILALELISDVSSATEGATLLLAILIYARGSSLYD